MEEWGEFFSLPLLINAIFLFSNLDKAKKFSFGIKIKVPRIPIGKEKRKMV